GSAVATNPQILKLRLFNARHESHSQMDCQSNLLNKANSHPQAKGPRPTSGTLLRLSRARRTLKSPNVMNWLSCTYATQYVADSMTSDISYQPSLDRSSHGGTHGIASSPSAMSKR